jgi:hypothetical protein
VLLSVAQRIEECGSRTHAKHSLRIPLESYQCQLMKVPMHICLLVYLRSCAFFIKCHRRLKPTEDYVWWWKYKEICVASYGWNLRKTTKSIF